jgi:hypothetical protein
MLVFLIVLLSYFLQFSFYSFLFLSFIYPEININITLQYYYMPLFTTTNSYQFIGPISMVEDHVTTEKNNEIKIYLGKFIKYIGFPYVSEWIHDAKAKFEYGTISKGQYDNVFAVPS